jgi:hypothetical protein
MLDWKGRIHLGIFHINILETSSKTEEVYEILNIIPQPELVPGIPLNVRQVYRALHHRLATCLRMINVP